MKAYKGFNPDMTCLGFQYEEGKEYETDKAELCNEGFHACERPLDIIQYYPFVKDGKLCKFHEVELEEVSDQRSNDDTKVVAKRIKIGAELNLFGLVKAQFEYVKAHTTMEYTDPNAASAGYKGAASAGYKGAASAGENGAASAGENGAASAGYKGAASAGENGAASAGSWGAASAGANGAASAGEKGAASAGANGAASAGSWGAAVSRGTSEVGKNGIACTRGNGCKVKGGMGAVLVIAEENTDGYDIKSWKAFVIDGEKYKPDTWYTLKDGEIAEVTE